eukprot:scaffold40870_cov60-Phaeocystis_antarctica.AAC.1
MYTELVCVVLYISGATRDILVRGAYYAIHMSGAMQFSRLRTRGNRRACRPCCEPRLTPSDTALQWAETKGQTATAALIWQHAALPQPAAAYLQQGVPWQTTLVVSTLVVRVDPDLSSSRYIFRLRRVATAAGVAAVADRRTRKGARRARTRGRELPPHACGEGGRDAWRGWSGGDPANHVRCFESDSLYPTGGRQHGLPQR